MPKRFVVPFVLLGLFIAYIIFQSRAFIFPPRLLLDTPLTVRVRVGQEMVVKGRASSLSRVFFNGEEVPVAKGGIFSQPLLIENNVREIEVKVTNRFGRENVKVIEITSNQ